MELNNNIPLPLFPAFLSFFHSQHYVTFKTYTDLKSEQTHSQPEETIAETTAGPWSGQPTDLNHLQHMCNLSLQQGKCCFGKHYQCKIKKNPVTSTLCYIFWRYLRPVLTHLGLQVKTGLDPTSCIRGWMMFSPASSAPSRLLLQENPVCLLSRCQTGLRRVCR